MNLENSADSQQDLILDSSTSSVEILENNNTTGENSTELEIIEQNANFNKDILDNIVGEEINKFAKDNSDDEVIGTEETNDTSEETVLSKLTFVQLGSPVPSSSNPKKPPLEKWAEGMGELINFENLPNYTGTYNKMRGIIKKIRDKLTN